MSSEYYEERLSKKLKSQINEILETNPLLGSFTNEQITLMEKEGFTDIITLNGKTLRKLNNENVGDAGLRVNNFLGEILELPSVTCDVAFNPNDMFIAGSENKTYRQQLEIFLKQNTYIQDKIPGVKLLLGSPPDLSELIFEYFKKTGKRVWPQDYSITNIEGVVVGNFMFEKGLNIDILDKPSPFVKVAELVIPEDVRYPFVL